jgi:glutamate formiminotransferase
VDVIAAHDVEVFDWSADPDHHRSVITYVGAPPDVESASVAAAAFAIEHIDLGAHRGVHPRVGALDVLPFVPLRGVTMDEAIASAHRVGARLAELGLPVLLYGRASNPPGRRLSDLRRGGFELLREGFPPDRMPDFAPEGCWAAHPSAGVTCVGARPVLLAWNVFVDGISLEDARSIASALREGRGGFPGLRVLGLRLEHADRVQISMNLEDPARISPMEVFRALESAVIRLGGRTSGTEVVGMVPDTLVLPAAADRLDLLDPRPSRLLSHRVAEHIIGRLSMDAEPDGTASKGAAGQVLGELREVARRGFGGSLGTKTPDEEP